MNDPEKTKLKKIQEHFEAGGGYHTLKFPDGFVLQGKYDMSNVIQNYKIPNDLTGKTVLDIGPGNGFFSMRLSTSGLPCKSRAIKFINQGFCRKLPREANHICQSTLG